MAEHRWFLWAVCVVIVGVLVLPAGALAAPMRTTPTSHPTPSFHAPTLSAPTGTPSSSASSHALTQAKIVQAVQSAHVPSRYVFYPNFNAPVAREGGLVTPTYSHAPAPIGVADMGITNTTGTATGSILSTPSFEGQITFNDLSAFYMDDDSTDYIGAQLNTVVANVTLLGNSSNSFWTQNVLEYSQRSNLLQFLDNIWNFSSSAFYMSPDVFNQTSPNGTLVAPTFYYGLGPVINISMPFTVNVFTNVSVTNVGGLPYDIVYFNYSVYKSGAFQQGGAYDWAIFNSQNLAAPLATIEDPLYQVNGYDLTPTGYLPYDAELVFCGPGGGSTTNIQDINATLDLWYWNTTTDSYQNVPSAVAYGTNTGETLDGIAEWYDAAGAVHAGPGPSLPYLFWNSSPTSAPGYITVSGPVVPSNAFVFFNQSVNYNFSFAAWAPVPTGGAADYRLPLGDYSAEVMLSNYDPMSFTVLAATPSTYAFSAVLTSDPAMGVYTPLYAFDNSQLAAISTGGTGSSSNPYLIANDQSGSLDPTFARMNDFTFPVFSGLLLVHTNAYVDVVDPASFLVDFAGRTLTQANDLGLPTSNHLQIQLYGTTHVAVWNATGIAGWFSAAYLAGFPLASMMVWNSSHTLIGANVFSSEGTTLLLFGGTSNWIWGNWFLTNPSLADPNYAAAVMNGAFPFGPQVYESGDLIYNNALETRIPAYSPNYSIYGETFYSSFAATWVDQWNVSWAPATDATIVYGFNLTGSITGGLYQGGNFWWNLGRFGFYLPYDGGGLIAVGGDWLPLAGDTLTFSETGLPAGTPWSVTVDQLTFSIFGPSVSIQLLDGTYAWSAVQFAGWTTTPSSGSITLFQGPDAVVVTYAAIPSTYTLSLSETGLPSGTVWSASVNGAAASGNGTELNFTEPNGTYTWSVTPVSGLVLAHPGGTVTVNGADVDVPVTFSAPPAHVYTVSFVAIGLASGTTWTVTLAGVTVASALGVITFSETNGSYAYTLTNVTGFHATPTSGSVTVSGTSPFVDVTFAALPVTLSGTVNPSAASVWVDGSAVTVTGGAFSVSVSPGVHAIRATASGYYDYNNNVTVSIGQNLSVALSLNSQNAGASGNAGSLSGTNLALLAGIAVLAVIFLIGMVYFWSKARRNPVMMKPEPEAKSGSGGGSP